MSRPEESPQEYKNIADASLNLAPSPLRMSATELVSAMVIVVIWGSNFVVMKIGLREMGPMLLGGLRFASASVPLLLFVRKPDLPWRLVAAYGLTQGLGQFGCVFLAIHLGLPAGVASIVLQTQAFFTVIFATAFMKETSRASQWIGLGISICGLALITRSGNTGADAVPIGALLLCLLGAMMWAASNIVARVAQRRNPGYDALGLVVWGSCAPVIPFLLFAIWQDGLPATRHSLRHISWQGAGAVLDLGLVATVLAYSMWAKLLKRHPAGRVAPFSMLVPIVGLYAAWIVLDERLAMLQWIGVATVGAGLLLSTFGNRLLGTKAAVASGVP